MAVRRLSDSEESSFESSALGRNILLQTFAKVRVGCLGLSIKMSDIIYIPKHRGTNPFRQPKPPNIQEVTIAHGSDDLGSDSTNSTYSQYELLDSDTLFSQYVSWIIYLEILFSVIFTMIFKVVLVNTGKLRLANLLIILTVYLFLGVFVSIFEHGMKKSRKVDRTLAFMILLLNKALHLASLTGICLYLWPMETYHGKDAFTPGDIVNMTYISSIGVFGCFKVITRLGVNQFEEERLTLVLWKIMLSCYLCGVVIAAMGSLTGIQEDFRDWTYDKIFGFITFVFLWPLTKLLKLADLIEITEELRKKGRRSSISSQSTTITFDLETNSKERFWESICIDMVSINYCFISRLTHAIQLLISKKTKPKLNKLEPEPNLADKWKADGVYDEYDEYDEDLDNNFEISKNFETELAKESNKSD